MIAVDATVLGDLLFGDDARSAAAGALLALDPEWTCLELTVFEVGNVAWKALRFGGVDLADARAALKRMRGLVADMEGPVDESEILDVAVKDQLTFYDASHVWFARKYGLELRTRDTEILLRCPDVAKPMPEP